MSSSVPPRLGRALATLALLLSLLVGCDDGIVSGTGESPPEATALELAFAAAAAEHGVPVELLQAVAWAETRWEMIEGGVEHDGAVRRIGLMGLRSDRLAAAAARAGVEPDAVATDLDANLAAGAAELAALGAELGVADDLGAWAPAVARYAGLDGEAAASYVHGEVYAALRTGVVLEDARGVVGALAPIDVTPAFAAPVPALVATTDAPGAIWRGSPNHSARPAGQGVAMIIIHTCEGSYSSCWSWLGDSAAGASAHYVVSTGGEVSQLVRETRKAWHIAAAYDCDRNDGVLCDKDGRSSNDFTIGIEHAGFAAQSSWPASQIEASARLVCDVARDHGVPIDRFHIVGHGQLQPWNRTDPGEDWPWTRYLERVAAACGEAGGGGGEPGGGAADEPQVIDSNNANNDTQRGYLERSANWKPSSNVAGYQGSGYYYARSAAVADGAVFWFKLATAGDHAIDAWWTAAPDRSSATPFVVLSASGAKLATVTRDQRTGGGRWNALGTYAFPAGWNQIVVSRWTSGEVVVADAIRVR